MNAKTAKNAKKKMNTSSRYSFEDDASLLREDAEKFEHQVRRQKCRDLTGAVIQR